MTTHTDKALETLRLMGTTPEQWRLADIKWVMEERVVKGEVNCPDCHGRKRVVKDAAGNIMPRPVEVAYGNEGWHASHEAVRAYDLEARKQGGQRGNCERCRVHNPRARAHGYSMGKVPGLVKKMVEVGYPIWPEGVVKDSRFALTKAGYYHCQLCNKKVVKSGMVAVHTVGAGKHEHGMYVGEDCARKFLELDRKLKDDQMMEVE